MSAKLHNYEVQLSKTGHEDKMVKIRTTSFQKAALFARIDDPSWDAVMVHCLDPLPNVWGLDRKL